MARVQDEATHGDAMCCFSEAYAEARAKFLEAAIAAAAELHRLDIAEDECGKYTTDIAILRGSGPGLIVVSSGTHGVEGYAGSAIQVHLLGRLKGAAVAPTVVFVHAVNPYGMAHFRRCNENNVDVNRNALHPEQFQKLIENDRLRKTYMSFTGLFNPTRAPGCFYAGVGIWFHMVANIVRHGFGKLKTALVAATYTEQQGVFYGGQELQASLVLLQEFMTRQFSNVAASNVAWVDVHSGLGPCGVDVLLGGLEDEAEMHKLFPKVPGKCDGFQGGFGRSTDEVIASRCGEAPKNEVCVSGKVAQSTGYHYSVGILAREEWLKQFFKPDSGRALAFAQEFGTLKGISVARALCLENAGFHHDRKNHQYWRSFTRDAFYVRTPAWKKSVLERGEDVFRKIVARTEAIAC